MATNIPCRAFPWTDYHDLNLDFLLSRYSQFEADLEELKRRVKALEDWRIDIVEPDLITIKADIRDIKGDIISLGDRLTVVEGDVTINKTNINTLADNVKTYYIVLYPDASILLRERSKTGPIVDLTDPDIRASFFARLTDSSSSKGEINDRYFYVKDSSDEYYELTPYIDQRGVEFTYTTVNFVNNNKRYGMSYIVDPDTGIISLKTYSGGMSVFITVAELPTGSTSYRYDATEYPEYPYQFDIVSDKIYLDSIVLCFPYRISDFEEISDKISEYVKVTEGKATLYLKELPTVRVGIEVHAIG